MELVESGKSVVAHLLSTYFMGPQTIDNRQPLLQINIQHLKISAIGIHHADAAVGEAASRVVFISYPLRIREEHLSASSRQALSMEGA